MNFTVENSKLANVQTVRLEFTAADYNEAFKKELKEASKNINLPGFRAGHVPAGLVEKKYGADLLRGVIQKKSEEAVSGYIQENNLLVVGGILPNEQQESYDFRPGEDVSLIFDLLVAPAITLPSDLTLEYTKPLFDDAYWALFDKKLSRIHESHNGGGLLGDNTTIALALAVPTEISKEVTRSLEDDSHFAGRINIAADWDELPPSLQELLQGKKIGDKVLLAPEKFQENKQILSLDHLESMLDEDAITRLHKDGLALKVLALFSYRDQPLTRDILLGVLPKDDKYQSLSEEELLENVHQLHANKVQLALKLASVKAGLERLASEWEFDIPREVVELILVMKGAPQQSLAWQSYMQKMRLREEGFYRALYDLVKEEALQLDKDDSAQLITSMLAADMVSKHDEGGIFWRLMPDVYRVHNMARIMHGNEQLSDHVKDVMGRLNIAEAFFNTVDATFKEAPINTISWQESFFYLEHNTFKFRGGEKDLEDFRASFKSMTPEADATATTEAEEPAQTEKVE